MQLSSFSDTFNSIVSMFAQDDHEDERSNLLEEPTLDIYQEMPGNYPFGITSPTSSKRTHDDEEEELSLGQHKRQRISLDESEKVRIMTFKRTSRPKVKETHSKSISFIKVKQLNPPKIRAITKNQDGFEFGASSNLEKISPGLESQKTSFNRYQISNRFLFPNAKGFQPFVTPFSTPFHGFQPSFYSQNSTLSRNHQKQIRNHSLAFCDPLDYRCDHVVSSSSSTRKRSIDTSKEEIIDDFLKDADPFQWSYPAPFQLGLQVKVVKKDLNHLTLCHNQDVEEGQTDKD